MSELNLINRVNLQHISEDVFLRCSLTVSGFFLHQVCVYIKMLCSTTSVWVHIRIHINLLLCRLPHYLMGFRFPGNCYLRQLRACAVNANVSVHLYFQHTEAGKTVYQLSKQISSETMFFSSTIFSCVWQASDSSNPNSFLLDFTSFSTKLTFLFLSYWV